MDFLDRVKERQKKERKARRAEVREEQRQDAIREQKLEEARELDQEQMRREEALRLNEEFQEVERKAKQKAAIYRDRYLAGRQAETASAKRAMNYRRSRSEQMRSIAHSEERGEVIKELFRQGLRERRKAEEHDSEISQERRDRMAEAKRLEARSAKNHAGTQEDRRRENFEARRLEEDEAEKSKERKSIIAEARREDERSHEMQRETERQQSRLQAARGRSAELTGQSRRVLSAQRIPSGRLSGSLPWLRVNGRYLVDEMSRPVSLRGVTIKRLEHALPEGEAFLRPFDDMDLAAFQEWEMSVLAITVAQDLALEGLDEAMPEDYFHAIDETVQSAAKEGIYTVLRLSLQSSILSFGYKQEGGSSLALPDTGSVDLWATLARRYSDEPAVLFDLFNTPNKPSNQDSALLGISQLFWPVWKHWLMAMIGAIRREHPRAVILARGPVGDLSGFPLKYSDGSQVNNIVYATEISPSTIQKGLEEIKKLTHAGCPCLLDIRADAQSGRQVEAFCTVLARDGIHWISADWMESTAPLAVRGRSRPEPTSLGRAFQAAIRIPPSPDANFEADVRRGCMQGDIGGIGSRLEALCRGCAQAENLKNGP